MIQASKLIWSLLLPDERKKFLVMLVMVLVLSLFEAASVLSILPFLQIVADPSFIDSNPAFRRLYNWLTFDSPQQFTIFVGILVFFITVFGLVMKAVTAWMTTRFTMMRAYSLSSRLLAGYLHQPYIWFLSRHSADLSKSVLSEVNQTVSGAIMPAMQLIPAAMLTFILISILFLFEPWIALGGTVLLGGAYAGIYFAIRSRLQKAGAERLAANEQRFQIIQEAMGGIKEMKLIELEYSYLHRFRQSSLKISRIQTEALVLTQIPRFALEGLAFGGIILLILVLLARGDGSVSGIIPTLGLIAVAGMRLFPALQKIYSQISTIRFNFDTLQSIHSDIETLSSDRNLLERTRSTDAKMGLHAKIELKGVQYQYPSADRAALNGLTLEIPANSIIGIVGGTGAGKTTVVDILLGLLTPERGSLVVDGKTVTPATIRSWQKSAGYVPQEIYLTEGSVTSNIAFGVRPADMDMDAVIRAAKTASLHDFVVHELKDGYNTLVGERGARLSGGQRQRVGIARALYHNPDVLIMDEATSALDNLTERDVMSAINNMAGKKTIIMIAHRLTTVKNCDKIFLLRNGQVAASGRFAEIIEQDDEFREMAAGL